MKRPAFRLVSEGGPLHITFGSLFAHETNVLHVVTLGTTVEHETVADDLHEFRAKLFGETFAGLLGGQTGTVEHGAFDELALLDGLVRLFDGVFAQIVLPTWMSGLSLVARPRSCLTCFLVSAICVPFLSTNTRSSLA